MPVQPTYPGVYVQEVPSGVRTITGVSTSVTAFVGMAKKGPVDKAVHLFSYAEFERRFGGLDQESELSYAVRSFFLNGGSQAIVVRLSKDASQASATLKFGPGNGDQSLEITALEAGQAGNYIEVRTDYNTSNPDSTFNLTLNYNPPDSNSDSRTESFLNLSMNSKHPRYVEKMVNGVSNLVTVKRLAATPSSPGSAFSAMIESADESAYLAGIDATHNQFRIAVNGSESETVNLQGPYNTLPDLAIAINGAGTGQWQCAIEVGRLKITSNQSGEYSRVEIMPGIVNDVSVRLKLGPANGGKQVDAVASIRPLEKPEKARLAGTSVDEAAFNSAKTAAGNNERISISLDKNVALDFTIKIDDLSFGDVDMAKVASRIESAVRALRPSTPAYDRFICSFVTDHLELMSGTRGAGSFVQVEDVGAGQLASHFGIKKVSDAPENLMLTGGNEFPFEAAEAYPLFIGNRNDRKGIYALDDADIFNILCLPGIEDAGILMDAESYCRERRAFIIIDPPQIKSKPAEISQVAAGTLLPKSDHAAVYYPWIRIPDPLNGGQPRSAAPCGVMAGLFARTDSARGVWKAPAGTDANLVGVQGLDYLLTDGENGALNPLGVNCLRIFPASGPVAWGARTLRGNDQLASEWKYIPIRRTALFIEESLYRGLKWVVFEPNDEPLWAQIRLNVGAFMHNLFRQGAFQGQTKREAYFVKCDAETTTQNDINLGIVNVWVGFAPLKPAEFVILYLQQMAGQIQL